MKFRSRIDGWVLLVLLAVMALALHGAVAALQSGAGWLTSVGMALFGAALPCWVLLSTRYTVAQGQVRVTSGPFSWCIPVADITRITPTRSPMSSPALSLDRLRIEYRNGRKALLVSPAQPEAFVQAVQAAGGAVRPAG